jgi:hypothetical protein
MPTQTSRYESVNNKSKIEADTVVIGNQGGNFEHTTSNKVDFAGHPEQPKLKN